MRTTLPRRAPSSPDRFISRSTVQRATGTLAMLAAGSTGNGDKFAALLGRAPLSYREFLKER